MLKGHNTTNNNNNNNNVPHYWDLTSNIFLNKALREVEHWEGEGENLQKQHASKLIPCKPLCGIGEPLLGVNEMNSLGHLILFLEHLNCLNALASKQTSKWSLHPRHCCLCGWNLYKISPPRGEKSNAARTTFKLSGGYPFTGWGAGQAWPCPHSGATEGASVSTPAFVVLISLPLATACTLQTLDGREHKVLKHLAECPLLSAWSLTKI